MATKFGQKLAKIEQNYLSRSWK